MDIIKRHFAAENAHDVAATLATYTDDVIWDDVDGPFLGVDGGGARWSRSSPTDATDLRGQSSGGRRANTTRLSSVRAGPLRRRAVWNPS